MAAVLFAFALLGAPAGPASAQPVGSFADLAERLSPAVVNIATAQTVEQPQRNGQGAPEGSPFDDLFRDFFENGQPRAPQTVQSLGSGFVISPIYLTKDTREPIRGKSGSKGPRPSLS
jgi:serine protease Do